MCGRITFIRLDDALVKQFSQLDYDAEPKTSYNVAPTQDIPVIYEEDSRRIFNNVYWGLIPGWTKDFNTAYKTINARVETVAEKPTYRTAFKRYRCIVVASGFYEWKKSAKEQRKTPYYFHAKKDQYLAFAGLRELWKSPDGKELKSACIITGEASQNLKGVHDREPIALQKNQYKEWLDPENQDTQSLLKMLGTGKIELEKYVVSTRVNNPEFNTAQCIEKAKTLA